MEKLVTISEEPLLFSFAVDASSESKVLVRLTGELDVAGTRASKKMGRFNIKIWMSATAPRLFSDDGRQGPAP